MGWEGACLGAWERQAVVRVNVAVWFFDVS